VSVSEDVPSGTPLTRAGDIPAPVRIVHLGLGNFFRAHQAWYTAHAEDAADWGIVAFTGRSTALADALTDQDGLYTLITRSATGDTTEIISSVSRAHPGADLDELFRNLADPRLAVVTLTVTEAGYLRGGDGVNRSDPAIQADVKAWTAQRTSLRTVPARLAAGLDARRAAGVGPIAIVPCDNLPDNGRVVRTVLTDFARAVEPGLAEWITETVSFVTTMVDRITPATTDDDRSTASRLTGFDDQAPVVTEPFTEWVLAGDFPAGRPRWQDAGARFVDDVTPYEERKLWLLNGGHSLLAYIGSARGHLTVAEAVSDPECLAWLEEWWDLAGSDLSLSDDEVAEYRAALLDRFRNPRIRHLLSQIAADGSQKLPIRVLPALRGERAVGRIPIAAVRILAGWINHLRGSGGAAAPVRDPDGERLVAIAAGDHPAAAVLGALDPTLVDDAELVAAVQRCADDLAAGTALEREHDPKPVTTPTFC
jgi:fructuronate reductase